MNSGSVALVAGGGLLPLEIARRLHSRGEAPFVYSIGPAHDELFEHARSLVVLSRLELEALLADMEAKGVKDVILAGLVSKTFMYEPAMLDSAMKKLLTELSSRDDHSLLGAIVKVMEERGFAVLKYRHIIEDWMAPLGHIAGRRPSQEESEDISYGVGVASHILPLSFGQTVVVKGRAVVAVEAMEGTDLTLRRAGRVCRGGVVVKMMRQDQDERYDLPVIGKKTIDNMAASGLTCLAVEAGRTVILDPERFKRAASKRDIAVVGVAPCRSL